MNNSKKVSHEYPMLSLDSHLNIEDVKAFDQRVRRELDVEAIEYTVEPKFDGLSVELVYEHGSFIRGFDAGRWSDWRGYHAQSSNHPLTPPSIAKGGVRFPRIGRAGRGLHETRGFS